MVGFRKAGHLLESSLCRCEMIQAISEEGKYATASWLKHRPSHSQVRPQTFSDLSPLFQALCSLGIIMLLCLISASKAKIHTHTHALAHANNSQIAKIHSPTQKQFQRWWAFPLLVTSCPELHSLGSTVAKTPNWNYKHLASENQETSIFVSNRKYLLGNNTWWSPLRT